MSKDFLLELGERNVNPENTDELLKSKLSEKKRKEIEREEEKADAKHEAEMAELKKKKSTSDAAVEKTGEKKEESSGFKTTGEIKMGVIDLQAERQQAVQELKDLKKEQEDTLKAVGQENQQLRDRIHEQEMKVISTSFEAALVALKEKLESKGTITDQITGIRAMAKELGMTQPDPGVSDPTLQIQMLQLQHQEAQRDREFQWQMQKDREAREDRKEELKDNREAKGAEFALQREKNEMFAKAPEMIGTAIAKGMMASGGETEVAASPGVKGQAITAGVGQGGEAECVQCHQPVAVGPTAKTAVCAGCGAKYPIRRVQAESPGETEEE